MVRRNVWAVGAAGGVALAGAAMLLARRWQLRWATTEGDGKTPTTADGIVTRRCLRASRSVAIAAPPELVWPWLVQVGNGRAGWYGVDWGGSRRYPSALQVLTDLQKLDVGDEVPSGAEGVPFLVRRMESGRLLELSMRQPHTVTILTLDVAEDGEGGSRLRAGLDVRAPATPRGTAALVAGQLRGLAVLRSMLPAVKQRAEETKEAKLEALDFADVPQS